MEQDALLLWRPLWTDEYWEGPGREPEGERIRATLVLR